MKQKSMWSLREVDKVPLIGLPFWGGTPWCSETLTFEVSIGLANVGGCAASTRKFINQTWP